MLKQELVIIYCFFNRTKYINLETVEENKSNFIFFLGKFQLIQKNNKIMGVFYIELREYLDASNIILKWISLFGVPLIGVIMSQWITRKTVMNPNKEKISRLFKNIFRFFLLVIVLDILLFLSVSEVFGEIKDINTLKQEIWKPLYIFTAFNMIYAIVLFPIFIKEKKYYEIEIAHYNNETKRYIVLDRIKENDDEIPVSYTHL